MCVCVPPRFDLDAHLNGGAVASQYQYQPALLDGNQPYPLMNPIYMDGTSAAGVAATATNGLAAAPRHLPKSGGAAPASASQARPRFEMEHWRISLVDRTQGIGIDALGLDVAAQEGAGWQVGGVQSCCLCYWGVIVMGNVSFGHVAGWDRCDALAIRCDCTIIYSHYSANSFDMVYCCESS